MATKIDMLMECNKLVKKLILIRQSEVTHAEAREMLSELKEELKEAEEEYGKKTNRKRAKK